MRAAVLAAGAETMSLEDLPTPEPRAGEVLIRVRACGVCHTDLHVLKNEVPFPRPCVLGHEVAGVVAAVGPGVEGYAVGQRVVGAFLMPCGRCGFCVRGRDDLCELFFTCNRQRGVLYDGQTRLRRPDGQPVWMYSMGGLAEYAVVPATALAPLPDDLPLEEAAVLGCAVLTAYGAVRHAADLRAGMAVAVVAVGGVGASLIPIARAFGAWPVVAVDVRSEKLDLARSLGATHLVDAGREDPVAAVRALTGGRGVDVAFEALGRPETVGQAVEMVCDGGRTVLIGIAPVGVTAPLAITRLVRRGLQVVGSYGARTRADLPAVVELARRGVIDLQRLVSRRYPLAAVNTAYAALARGEIVGRAIIVP